MKRLRAWWGRRQFARRRQRLEYEAFISGDTTRWKALRDENDRLGVWE